MIIHNGSLEVRWFRDDELAELVAVHTACFPEENWRYHDFNRFVNKRKGQVVKVIVDHRGGNEKVIGSLLYRIDDTAVRIARIGVLPAHRRCGTGSFALRELTGPGSVFKTRLRFTAYVHETKRHVWDFFRKLNFRPPSSGSLVYDHFPADATGIRRDAVLFELRNECPGKKQHRKAHADC